MENNCCKTQLAALPCLQEHKGFRKGRALDAQGSPPKAIQNAVLFSLFYLKAQTGKQDLNLRKQFQQEQLYIPAFSFTGAKQWIHRLPKTILIM